MYDEIAAAPTPAAQYVAKYTREYSYLWDELEAAALLDPTIITKEQILYIDVDTQRGPNYGDTLSWTAANRPKYTLQPVHVQVDLDQSKFDALFVELPRASSKINTGRRNGTANIRAAYCSSATSIKREANHGLSGMRKSGRRHILFAMRCARPRSTRLRRTAGISRTASLSECPLRRP
jgi:hypothetical protein